MIPYDDLVAALSQWRARQGLPVSSVGAVAAAPNPGSGPTASPGSGPHASGGSGSFSTPTTGSYGTKPGSGPNRGAPPAQRGKQPSIPPPLEEPLDVADEEMLEEHYENEGGDFAMGFGGAAPGDDATAIGGAPDRPTDPNDFGSGKNSGGGGGGGGRDDW